MRHTLLLSSAVLLVGLGAALAQQKDTQDKPKEGQAAEAPPAPVPSEVDNGNPVKPTAEGLAEARKLYGNHCAMCHGKDGSGKGDVANQMKLQLSDWRNPETLSKYTDGALFYIITNGRGKMVGGEGDSTKAEIRWNLVNLVRSFGKKAEEPAKP